MNDEDFEKYRVGCYNEYLRYYDKRAVYNQKAYHVCSIYITVVSVFISPILAFKLPDDYWSLMIVCFLSPTLVVVAGISAHFKYHANWLRYRATWDALKHEEAYRNAEIDAYGNVPDKNKVFVSRVEELITMQP